MDKDKPEGIIVSPLTQDAIRTAEFREIYSNICRAAFSNWDIQITFSLGTTQNKSVLIEDKATIYLTPAQAKAALKVIANAVGQFEQHFGEIQLSADQQPINIEEATPSKEPH